MSSGRSVRLFLVDGSPSGLITAEIMNWTGHLLLAPRLRLGEALRRPEADRTGVYFLVGDDPEDPTRQAVYVGEGDSVADRIKLHAKDETKDFWEKVCFVTSKDPNITKAHVRYLETRIIEIARTAGRATLTNANMPGARPLPEADVSDMEYFLEQLHVVLPVLGLDFLKAPVNRASLSARPTTEREILPSEEPVEIELNRAGVQAEGALVNEEIVVFAGSQAATKQHAVNTYSGLRDRLMHESALVPIANSDLLQFSKDTAFTSPSAASSVILNRNDNGRTSWRIKATSQTLKEWEQSQISSE
jgi:Domain of unknown function (DUF4357)